MKTASAIPPVATAFTTDKTEYARSLGYTGQRPVIVSDGRVISHGNRDWFLFCDGYRLLRLQRKLNELSPRGRQCERFTVHCGHVAPVHVWAHNPDEACDLIGVASRQLLTHETTTAGGNPAANVRP